MDVASRLLSNIKEKLPFPSTNAKPPPVTDSSFVPFQYVKAFLVGLRERTADIASELVTDENSMPESRDQMLLQLLKLALSLGISYFVGMKLIEMMDPTRKEKNAAKLRVWHSRVLVDVATILWMHCWLQLRSS